MYANHFRCTLLYTRLKSAIFIQIELNFAIAVQIKISIINYIVINDLVGYMYPDAISLLEFKCQGIMYIACYGRVCYLYLTDQLDSVDGKKYTVYSVESKEWLRIY